MEVEREIARLTEDVRWLKEQMGLLEGHAGEHRIGGMMPGVEADQLAVGNFADRPTAGKAGRVFHAKDARVTLFHNGTNWWFMQTKSATVTRQVGVIAYTATVTWDNAFSSVLGAVTSVRHTRTTEVPNEWLFALSATGASVRVAFDADPAQDFVVYILGWGTI